MPTTHLHSHAPLLLAPFSSEPGFFAFCGGETGLVLLTYAERSFSATQRAAVGTGYGLSETLHLLVYQIDRQLIINGIFKQIWILIGCSL